MIKVYTGIKGYLMVLLMIAAGILLISFFFWGFAEVIKFFLPIVIAFSYLMIIVFILGILPSSVFKDLRPVLAAYCALMAQALGMSAWLLSFFYVITAFGFGAIFFIMFLQFLAPIALVGAAFKSSWHIVTHLAVWTGFMYTMRFYGKWLSNLNTQEHEVKNIIDVDIIEVPKS